MDTERTSEGLGPLPATSYTLASGGSFTWVRGWDEAHMRAYALQERAAERERWVGQVRAMVAAHDAGMVRLNTAMRAQGVDRITLPAEAADELRAIQALRDLVGPNGSGEPPERSARPRG